ncbi:nuclease [Phenylobacterium sp. NIBR 498073]|uniref:thermonuclease family protein n=1 Tax=Phenylobacterium sp. NIBR 498073 TaxID=3015177 RepID=UPI0022B37088|nr:nuclease [Phenylobacterium sp. NIBR 498073]WGU41396.1 nuclease [Phenylobacterium sp. NIBR 498073]
MIRSGVVLAMALSVPHLAHADPCTAPLPSAGTVFSGAVRYVGDGDSLCVGSSADPGTWIEVRLSDFYAPELAAPGGHEAKNALSDLAEGRKVSCRAGKRSYDRVVAQCSLNGADLGDLLRRRGVIEGGNGWR